MGRWHAIVALAAGAMAALPAASEAAGLRDAQRARELQDAVSDVLNLELLDGLELWQKYLIMASVLVVALLLLICFVCCCVRLARRNKAEMDMLKNPYVNEWSGFNASGRTLVDNHNLEPSPGLANFMKNNMPSRAPADDAEEETEPSPPSSPAMPLGGNKRVSTRHTGNDYGLLDEEARQRIASIRMEGNLIPIQPAKPSAKALKMLGVEEDAIARPFDEDIQTRMKRLAEKSGGGLYNPGMATARLGNQIADGFKARRAKQLEKARLRREREAERKASLKPVNASGEGESRSKPPPPAQPKQPPGPDKLAAFLQSTSAPPTVSDSEDETSDADGIDATI